MDFSLPAPDDPRRIEARGASGPQLRRVAAAGLYRAALAAARGLAADAELQLIIDDELTQESIRAPNHVNPAAINNCAQSLLKFGTPAQQECFLVPALACEETWGVLFSEPGLTDYVLAGTAVLPHETRTTDFFMASLNQTMWFYAPVRTDDWLLCACSTPAVQNGRGIGRADIFDPAGRLVASATQEVLIREAK